MKTVWPNVFLSVSTSCYWHVEKRSTFAQLIAVPNHILTSFGSRVSNLMISDQRNHLTWTDSWSERRAGRFMNKHPQWKEQQHTEFSALQNLHLCQHTCFLPVMMIRANRLHMDPRTDLQQHDTIALDHTRSNSGSLGLWVESHEEPGGLMRTWS